MVTSIVADIIDETDTLGEIEDDTLPQREINDEAVADITELEVTLTRADREARPIVIVAILDTELLIVL